MIAAAAALIVGGIIGWRVCAWERDRGQTAFLVGLYWRGYLKREALDLPQRPTELREIIDEGSRRVS